MKEMIYQKKGDYLFWKDQDKYSILFLMQNGRKKEFEYTLNEKEKEKYFKDGLKVIYAIVEKKNK